MTLSFIGVGEGFTLTFDGEGCGDSKEFAFCERFTLASPLGARDSHSPSMERGVGTLASPQGCGDRMSPLFSPMR